MYQKAKLKNEFPVILVPRKDSKSVSLLVLFKVGSRYEEINIHHGVSHFIEHLMFKGTKKRPTTIDISKELDGIGAEFNAYTAKDHTGYWIKSSSDKFELACDLLSDMLNNSLFDANEIKREKGVIIEEIKMYEDQPMYFSEMLFERLVFSGNMLAEDIAGTPESIIKMSRKNILDFKNSYYEPKNGIIVIAGKINKNVKTVLNKYFAQMKETKNKTFLQKFNEFENKQNKPKVILHQQNTKQVHLAMGVPAYSYFHPDLYALHVLSIILGGTMSSRLFINIRERKGLCYYIKSQADVYEDTGNLMIRAGLELSKIDEAIRLILKELREIKQKGVTKAELKMAKEFLKGRSALQLEDSNYLANYYGRELLLTKKILTPEEKIKKIFQVSASQVHKVAKDILKTEKLNLAMISPYKDKNKYTKMLKI